MSCRPRTSSLWLIVLAACVTAVAIAADAQQTIPHQLASGGTSLKFGRFSTGRPPSIDMVLSHTDAIIRGTIAVQKRSYLSDDQQEVLTDYEIYNPELLYPATPGTPPLSVVVVTLPGGTVTINGLSYTLTDDSLPELPAARECLLLLNARVRSIAWRLDITAHSASWMTGCNDSQPKSVLLPNTTMRPPTELPRNS